MSLFHSTGVSQRRWLVKTGRFPLRPELTHIKGICYCNNSQASSGCLPRDTEIIAVFNLHNYSHRREYEQVAVQLKASDNICGHVIPVEQYKHQHCNLRLTKGQAVSHLKEHILKRTFTCSVKGKKYWNINLSRSKTKVVTRNDRGGSNGQTESGGAIWLALSFILKPKQEPTEKPFLAG